VGVAAGVVTAALAVRLLDLSEYGVLAFFMSFIGLFTGLTYALVTQGITRETVRRDAEGADPGTRSDDPTERKRSVVDLARGTVAFSFIGAAVTIPVLIVVATLTRSSLGGGERLLAGLALGAMAFATTNGALVQAIARGLRRFTLMEVPTLFVVIGRLVVIVAFTAVGRNDLGSVILGYGVVGVVSALLSHLVLSRMTDVPFLALRPAFGSVRSLAVLTFPYAVGGITMLVIGWADVLVLGLVSTVEEVGRYEPVLRLTDRLLQIVPALFVGPFLPLATSYITDGAMDRLQALYSLVSRAIFLLSLPIVILMAAFPEAVLDAIYGDRFPARPLFVWILLVGYVANIVTGLNYMGLVALGDRKAFIKPSMVATGVMLLLALTLIPLFGGVGAALATSLSITFHNIQLTVILHRRTSVVIADNRSRLMLATAMVPLGVAFAARAAGLGEGLIEALLISASLWAVWALFLGIAGVIRLPTRFSDLMGDDR
jgi:O-antigen/teichoic acid export membrane protein